jgi:hypothetical protein
VQELSACGCAGMAGCGMHVFKGWFLQVQLIKVHPKVQPVLVDVNSARWYSYRICRKVCCSCRYVNSLCS